MFGLDLQRGAFNNLEEGLLDTFAAHVFTMANLRRTDLVDLVQADYASLGSCYIVVRSRKKPLHAYLGIFTNISCLRERGAVGHAKGNSEDTGKCLGHQRLADSGRPEKENVRFVER